MNEKGIVKAFESLGKLIADLQWELQWEKEQREKLEKKLVEIEKAEPEGQLGLD